MSSLSNFLVQSDLQPSSEVIGSDRSTILNIETGVLEKAKESIDASSVDEEIDRSSDIEDDYSANDNGDQRSVDLQMPKRQYSREVLLQLKESPTSNIFPSCLEKSPKSILASHLQGKDQNSDKKTNETTDDNSNDAKRKQFKKKNAVEKEESGVGKKHLNVQDRLKKEEIVLSPQRRSFNTGCSGSSGIFNILPNRTITTRHRLDSLTSSKDIRDTDLTSEHRKQRLDSLTQNQPRDFSQLSRDANNRRLNRGRLMSRDSTWESDASVNYGFDKRVLNNSGGGGGGDRRLNNDEERNRYGYYDRKKNYNDEHIRIEKEPEWFSAGPTSQYDVIELQGFEDFRNEMRNKKSKKPETNAKKTESSANATKTKAKDTASDASKSESSEKKKTEESITDMKDSRAGSPLPLKPDNVINASSESEPPAENQSHFINNTSISPTLPDDVDAFLNFSNLLVDDDTEITKSGTSKFSRWFQPESSSNNVVNWISDKKQGSELLTDTNSFGQLYSGKDFSGGKLLSENETQSNSQWPSFNENSSTEKPNSNGKTMLERLLMTSPSPASSGNVIGNSTGGKVHSVEELEAHLRKPQSTKTNEDMIAFKKLFNQSKSSTGSTNPVSSAFNSNQIPIKPVVVQQQQPQPRVADVHQQPFGFQHQNFPVAAPDPAAAARLQQAQSEMLKMNMFGLHKQQVPKPTDLAASIGPVITPALGIFPPPAPLVESHPFLRNTALDGTLQKPEAQVLLQALKQGQITVAQLLDNNYSLPPRFREVVSGVLKYWLARQTDGGNIPLNNIAPQAFPILNQRPNERFVQPLLVPPPIQPEAITQLNVPMQPAFKQRIPSPQEIAIHTQGIMHNALVKKKLEEQRENYKRRQEMWRARSPATDDPSSSQLLSTFTPTSVLRQQKRKPDNNPAGGDQLYKFTDQLCRANDVQQQQQLNIQMQQQQQAKKFDMFMNKGRPIIKKSDASQFNTVETPYPVPPGQFRSQTPAPPSAAQNFLAGFVHSHESQQQQSHFGARNTSNLASATACLQGLLLDNRGLSSVASRHQMPGAVDSTTVTSHQGGFPMQSADEGGPLSRWFPTKLIEDGLAGKLPDIPAQKMLSVEELERVQTVQN